MFAQISQHTESTINSLSNGQSYVFEDFLASQSVSTAAPTRQNVCQIQGDVRDVHVQHDACRAEGAWSGVSSIGVRH